MESVSTFAEESADLAEASLEVVLNKALLDAVLVELVLNSSKCCIHLISLEVGVMLMLRCITLFVILIMTINNVLKARLSILSLLERVLRLHSLPMVVETVATLKAREGPTDVLIIDKAVLLNAIVALTIAF